MSKLSLKERLAMRWLGVEVSDDGTRWTIPRKNAQIVDELVAKIEADTWRNGTNDKLRIERHGDETVVEGPTARVTFRVV